MSLQVGIDVTAVPAKPAGAGRYVIELTQALARRDVVDATVVTRENDVERWKAMAGVEVVPKAPTRRPMRLVWEQLALPRVIKNTEIDVFHSPHYTMPEASKKPVVVTIHDMTLFDHPEWHERSKVIVFRRAIAVAVKRSKGLITVSNDTATRLKARFGDVDVTVIPHGVDHDRFNVVGSADDRNLLDQHGIPENYVAFVGTVEPRKNIPSLVRAFDRIAAKFPDLHLVIAGGAGWGTDELDACVQKVTNKDRVLQTGFMPDDLVPAFLRNARAVAYPSLAEGFGLPALEALACGAPLVTTTGSAMEEVVDDAALLVEPNDDFGLSEAIERLLTDDVARDHMRIRGPEVASTYTWDASAMAHEHVYQLAANR